METFAEYILKEKNLGSKMEIVYYLSKKEGIFFDASVVFKTELLRMFTNSVNLQLDTNLLLTANLLVNCKKIEIANDIEKIRLYAKEGAKYLSSIGFDERFCKICEGINRYQKQEHREPESDVLELVDQFGGMLLDRPERIGIEPDEAIVLLEYRNLKNVGNVYLYKFIDFVKKMEDIKIKEENDITPLKYLVKLNREASDVKRFITALIYDYESKVDDAICKAHSNEFFKIRKNMQKLEEGNPNRSLFSEETTRKVIGKLIEENKQNESDKNNKGEE